MRISDWSSDVCSSDLDLVPLIDRLAGRLGARRLFRMSAVESDVPERSVRRLSPLDTPENWPRWPRPVRFFQRAEPVDNVIALLPDGPPRRFTWRGRTHVVRRADELGSASCRGRVCQYV